MGIPIGAKKVVVFTVTKSCQEKYYLTSIGWDVFFVVEKFSSNAFLVTFIYICFTHIIRFYIDKEKRKLILLISSVNFWCLITCFVFVFFFFNIFGKCRKIYSRRVLERVSQVTAKAFNFFLPDQVIINILYRYLRFFGSTLGST